MSRRIANMLILLLPLMAIGVALWGTAWGWNSDRLLFTELIGYVVTAYALFLLPLLLTYVPGIQERLRESKLRPLGQDGLGSIVLGVDAVLLSVILIHLFESSALWLGSMSIFYVGFGMILVGVLWHLGKTRM